MKRILPLLFVSAAFSTMCSGQIVVDREGLPDNVNEPPKVAPPGCSITMLTQLSMVSGSDSYLTLRYEIKALELGHVANQQMVAATSSSRPSPNNSAEHILVKQLTGLSDAEHSYLCASYVLGGIKADDKEHLSAKEMLLTVYNRMALQARQFKTYLKQTAEMAESPQQPSGAKGAEVVSSIIEDHKDAQSDLKDATTMSTMLTMDLTDLTKAKADTLNISCSERASLLAAVRELSKEVAPDEFTNSAHLLQVFLNEPFKCRS